MFRFEYFVKTLLAHTERSALLKNVLLFHPVVPCMKNYRLVVDSAKTRRALSYFLKETQIYQRIWRAVTYQNAAISAKQSWSCEKSGYSRHVSDPVRKLAYLPETWTCTKSCQYTCWEDCRCGGETKYNWRCRWNDCYVWQNRRCCFA